MPKGLFFNCQSIDKKVKICYNLRMIWINAERRFSMLKTFKGGLLIQDYKEFTNKKSIKEIKGGNIHIFPLQ